jgi:hypothetical protein
MLVLVACGVTPAQAARTNNPIEAGDVAWGRDFDAALAGSGETGKPVFVLFQEIPGCSGVQEFGRTVLANPSLVKAIESEFIPVLVYNNRTGGMDGELLRRYHEPSWNYQVIRFLDASGRDVIPRKDRIWTTGGVASRMIEALRVTGRPVPDYLEDLAGVQRGDLGAR